MFCNILGFVLFCGVCTTVFGDHEALSKHSDKAGTYITTLVSVEKCRKPPLPYQGQKERSGLAVLEIEDERDEIEAGPTISGNYTSLKEDNDLRLNITDYQQEKGKWRLVSTLSGLNCHSRIVVRLARTFHINYDKETCAVPKGVYSFHDVDYNQVDHSFHSIRMYGKTLRRVILTSKKKTVVCYEFEAEVAPQD